MLIRHLMLRCRQKEKFCKMLNVTEYRENLLTILRNFVGSPRALADVLMESCRWQCGQIHITAAMNYRFHRSTPEKLTSAVVGAKVGIRGKNFVNIYADLQGTCAEIINENDSPPPERAVTPQFI